MARALLVTGVLTVATAAFWFGSTEPTHHWAPLNDAPLSYAEAGRLAQTLESMQVPYRTDAEGSGQSVLVPIERVRDLKMTMAADGTLRSETMSPYDELWKDGAPAFQTASMERAMRVHAKEKSIEQKLAALEPVKRAMVDLALPENSILRRQDHQATASVVIELQPRFAFTNELAISIKETVAHAVEGLTPDRVAVTDHLGRRIGPAGGDTATALASRTLALRQEQEARYEARIVELLEPVVGRGRVVARVAAQMDMSRVEQRSEEFDADNTVVRRERKTTDNSTSEDRMPRTPAGVGGNAPQRPDADPNSLKSRTNNDHAISELDYAVPKKVIETKLPMGRLERLSVAVVVDSVAPEPPAEDGAPAEDGTIEAPGDVETRRVRAAAIPSQRALAEIVKKAVGFDPARGDEIEILYTPFSRPEFPADATVAAPSPEVSAIPPWVPFAGVVAMGFVLVGGGFLATERRRRRLIEAQRRAAEEEARRKAAANGDEDSSPGGIPLRDEVRQLALTNSKATVQVLKEWLAVTPGR